MLDIRIGSTYCLEVQLDGTIAVDRVQLAIVLRSLATLAEVGVLDPELLDGGEEPLEMEVLAPGDRRA